MFKFFSLFVILLCCSLSFLDGKRRAASSSQHNLGDFCIPGTCTSLNSNCKRVGGSAFRCVCKEQFMSVNKTHCIRVINASMDSACASCVARGGICLDENTDDQMDRCFCQAENEMCHGKTTLSAVPMTQPVRKNVPVVTPAIQASRPIRQGELQMGLYDINQQRLIDNGGSVFIGDRLFIEIKYRTVDPNSDQHQIIVENCSIASSVSDNDLKLEKVSLLTNRCPSIDSRFSIRFQRIDPDHVKSSIFQISKFDTTSVVYLRCSIGICYGRIESCQERLCPEIRRAPPIAQRVPTGFANASVPSTSADSGPFDYVDEEGASVIALKRRKRRADEHEDDQQAKQKLARLISDLTWSMDQPTSVNHAEPVVEVNVGHYEVRQVQQQFTIETPLPQPVHKHKTAYEALYGRTSLGSQGAVERSTVIAAISIIFIIGISISLFVVYRTCYIEYAQRIYGSTSFAGFGAPGESVYGGLRGTSQACRYDMGRRSEQRFDESFFVSNVEPLGAYRRQY